MKHTEHTAVIKKCVLALKLSVLLGAVFLVGCSGREEPTGSPAPTPPACSPFPPDP